MHCGFRRTNIQTDAGQNPFLSREPLEQNTFNARSKDCEVSSDVWTNSNNRCTILTFIAVEPSGHCRIVALPLECSDNSIPLESGSGVNKEHLVSPSPVSPLQADRHKAQKGPARNRSYFVRPVTGRSFSGLSFQHQSQNQDLENKEDKAIKRNSRKKPKKKGKRNKKLSGDTGLSELGCVHGCSTSEADANKSIDNRVGCVHGCSAPKTCTSCTDKVDASESLVTSVLQNFSSENHLSSSENGLGTSYPGFPILHGEVKDTHCKPISSCDYPVSKIHSEPNDSNWLLDSVSLRSNSENSFNADAESAVTDLSKSPGYTAKMCCSSPGNMLDDVLHSNSHSEMSSCVRKGCTSDDRHSRVPEKREKQIKRVPKNSSVNRTSNVGHPRGRFEKENSHSVWQKVQRNDADGCNDSTKVNSVSSQLDIELKEAALLKKHPNVADSAMLSNSEDKNQAKLKVSGKMKRKTSSGLKQECNYYSRKESHAIKTRSSLGMRNNMKQNGMLDTQAQMSGQKEVDTVSRSDPKIGCPRNGFQSKRVESVTFRPVHSSQIRLNESEPPQSVYATVSSLNDQNAENQPSLLSISHNSVDPPELLEELPVVQLHRLVDEEKVKQLSSTATRQETTSGTLMRKWVPVGVKGPGLPNLNQPRSLAIAVEEESVFDSQTFVSSANTRAMCRGKSSENVNCSASEEAVHVQKLNNQVLCIRNEYSSNHAARKCLVLETEDHNISAAKNDLSKMGCALNDVKRAQWASEAIYMATGCPIAEFERLLRSASPVICPSYNIASCQTCLRDQVFGASLCRHETPNICLGNVWEWYEKHGSYGLEVRADDYENSNRLGMDSVSFRAYFVPFLSAVQLFRKCEGNHTDNSNEVPDTEAKEPSEMYRTSETSTSTGQLPIFSVLVPQPRTEEPSYLAPGNHVCYSDLSPVNIKDNASIQPVDCRWSDELELLFEYFEPEQPQKRQPLFDTIKELAKGDGHSQCRAYGDPTTLESVGLDDLHPKSWYSVAWYPIYRIPDANFRAAFLTYHSLGHLARRSSTLDSHSRDASIVSPVVGLQSYNAQGECWFRPRHSETADASDLNPAVVLKERLKTLEHTASLMARGTVSKGSQTYMNRQPDYEFFLSRRR